METVLHMELPGGFCKAPPLSDINTSYYSSLGQSSMTPQSLFQSSTDPTAVRVGKIEVFPTQLLSSSCSAPQSEENMTPQAVG